MTRPVTFLFLLALLSLNVCAHAALIGPTPVAVRGTPSPAGGTFDSFNSTSGPVLSSSGQVAFSGSVSGGSSSFGIFSGFPDSLQAVALVGAPALAGGNYVGFFPPVINASGHVAFRPGLSGGSSTEGVFAGVPGSLQVVALRGADAPAGGNYNFIGDAPLNPSGQVAILTVLTSGSYGLFVGAPGSLQTAALQGTAAPAGGNYNNIGLASLNSSGQVAYFANLTGGTSSSGIFAGAAGSMQAAALQGSAAPAGGNYATFTMTTGLTSYAPGLNNAGQVAFAATLTGGTSTGGVFAGAPGSVEAVALQGSAAPAGGTFNSFRPPVLNAAEQVAFPASLTGGSSTNGIFAGAPGSLRTIALQGAATPEGVGNFNALATTLTPDGLGNIPAVATSVTINASGYVAFTSSLSGGLVNSTNDYGLYVGSGAPGSLIKIVREGDVVDIDPSPLVNLRTVERITFDAGSGGEDGQRLGFNDAGLLIYRLVFTGASGGGTGIFISQIDIVPEPTTLILATAPAAMLIRVRRRTALRR